MLRPIALALAALATVSLAACNVPPSAAQPSAKNAQAAKAADAANSITFTENAEIDNIKRRIGAAVETLTL